VKSHLKEYEHWGQRTQRYDEATACVVGEGALQETKVWLPDQLQDTDRVLEESRLLQKETNVICAKRRKKT
jgi:hypothetical protein